MGDESPPIFAGYTIQGELGRGGMGVVYKAYDPNLRRSVALKVLLQAEHASRDDIERFFREAESAARLNHPNIVPVHELDVHEGRHYYTMDYIEGEPLDVLIEDGELDVREGLALMEKVARALHYAHSQGIVHRDLKPANIIVDPSGEPKVSDFGLAKLMDAEKGGRRPAELTFTGVSMGTPAYMSPEQAKGDSKAADARTDIYALGCILYEMIGGAPPFAGCNPAEMMSRHISDCPAPPRKRDGAGIATDLATICLKCLEKEPARRYQTAGELADDIRRFLDGEPISARPASVMYRLRRKLARHRGVAALAAVALLLLAGALGWGSWRTAEERQRAGNEAAERGRKADKACSEGMLLLNRPALDVDPAKTKEKRYRQLEEARRHFAEALALVPDHFDALGGMSRACNEQWRLVSDLQLDARTRSELLIEAGRYRRLLEEAMARRKQ